MQKGLNLNMPQAKVHFFPNFFGEEDACNLFNTLKSEINWQQNHIKIFGKEIPEPRLTAWHGDPNVSYTYSGIQMTAAPWTKPLLEIKERIEEIASVQFNSVLLNYYRFGQDSMGWHSDDEPELGINPIIGSVSFGAERVFHFKHKKDKSLKQKIVLTNGSFLLMAGETQHHWLHQIPKTKREIGGRINLTFRLIR